MTTVKFVPSIGTHAQRLRYPGDKGGLWLGQFHYSWPQQYYCKRYLVPIHGDFLTYMSKLRVLFGCSRHGFTSRV